jgi:hypothetical protein
MVAVNEGSMDGLSLTIPIVHAGVYKRGSSPHQKPSTAWMLWQRPHGWVYAIIFILPSTVCCVDRGGSRSPCETLSSIDAAAEAPWMDSRRVSHGLLLATRPTDTKKALK